jgi:hypothetical protein
LSAIIYIVHEKELLINIEPEIEGLLNFYPQPVKITNKNYDNFQANHEKG